MTREPRSSPRIADRGEDGEDDAVLRDDALSGLLREVARAAPVRPEELAAALARSNLVGRSVGHFQVTERLGAGGMGVVYGAHDRRLGRRVALKVLAPRIVGEERGARPSGRFQIDVLLREARAAAAITHPNVATVYAAGEADGLSYIAMEYVDGVTLRSRLAAGPLPIADVARYARQIADGLAKAHERGVVHRDLKPDNVMIDRDDRIKILDFGLAGAARDPDADSSDALPPSRRGAGVAGTPPYMSPEQASGERMDAQSDVYSFGVVVYEALTGVTPFGDRKRETGPWSFAPVPAVVSLRPDVPPALGAIVARCLAPSPRERYASGGLLLRALDAAAVAPHGEPGAQRSRLPFAITGGVFLALVASAGAWHFARHGEARRSETPTTAPLAPALKRLTANIPEQPVMSAALSPDGETLAFVDRTGLGLKPVGGGAARMDLALQGAPAPQIVAWFPDGDRLAVCTAAPGDQEEELWVVSRSKAVAPRRIGHGPFTGIAVSPDGRRVAFAANDSVGWLPADAPGDAKSLVQKDGHCFITEVAWAPDGQRIAYASLCFDSLAATAIETVAVTGGAPTVTVADPHLYNSFVRAAGVLWSSPDEIVYPRTEWLPAEAGSNLWAVKVDPRTGAAMAPPRRLTSWVGVGAAALSASREKDRIAFIRFESQADVYVADVADGGRALGGPPRRLTLSDRNERPSAWSRDGRGVYFFSDATGNFDIAFQEIAGGPARSFAAEPAWETSSQLSPDGKSLLYWRFPAVVSDDGAAVAQLPGVRLEIVRRDIDGGPPAHVLFADTLAHPAGEGRPAPWEMRMRCPKREGASCILSERTDDGALTFYSFDPVGGRGETVFRVEEPTAASNIWDISPDGTALAIPRANGPIAIQPLRPGAAPTLVSVPGCDPVTPAWSADGKGLFVSVDCNADEPPFRLYYVGLDGSASLLWSAPSVYILEPEPSPDGEHLAIAVRKTDDDVWMIEGVGGSVRAGARD